jgi:hypothetical protein
MMNAPINLNHKFCLFTEEIDYEALYDLLTSKLVASKLSIAKHCPESGFCFCHLRPQRAGKSDFVLGDLLKEDYAAFQRRNGFHWLCVFLFF